MSVYTRYTLGLSVGELTELFRLTESVACLSLHSPAQGRALPSLAMDFCGEPQYVHFDLNEGDANNVVAYFEGNPILAEALEIQGPYLSLHQFADYLAVADDTGELVNYLRVKYALDRFARVETPIDAPTTPEEPTPAIEPTPAPPSSSTSRRWWVGAGVVVVVGAGALAGWYLARKLTSP
jgi:hypothetical protein